MQLLEYAIQEGASAHDGVLRDVVVLGPVSRNKRRYTPEAMRGAVPLYEGKGVYLNHPQKGQQHRSAEDRFGTLANVRFVEGEGKIRADLPYLESHPMVPRVREDLTKKLGLFGLSHVADGTGRKEGDVEIVESITAVAEVGLVTNPATTRTLLEQGGADASADPATLMADAMAQQVMAIIKDTTKDIPAKLDAIKMILEQHEELQGEGAAPSDGNGAAAGAAESLEQKVSRLVEAQIDKIAQKKYTKPTLRAPAPEGKEIPADPPGLARWLRSR